MIPTQSPRTELLTSDALRNLLGISVSNSYRIMHAHGIKLGKQYYITADKLAHVLNETPGVPLESHKQTTTRAYTKRAGRSETA